MGRAWVLCVPPTPAGPGPGPPFLCGVALGQQRCSGQGGEVGLLSRVGFLGFSLFSKHFSVLFAVCGTLGEMCWRGDVTPRGPCCPPCPPRQCHLLQRGAGGDGAGHGGSCPQPQPTGLLVWVALPGARPELGPPPPPAPRVALICVLRGVLTVVVCVCPCS